MQYKPFEPFVTLEHFYRYPEISTGSILCDAVADVLYTTRYIRVAQIARYMKVEARKLSCGISLFTGMSLNEIVKSYRLRQVQQYMLAHPKDNLQVVARTVGFASDTVLADLFRRECHGTPEEFLKYLLPMLEAGLTENKFMTLRPDGVYVFRSDDHTHYVNARVLKEIQKPLEIKSEAIE